MHLQYPEIVQNLNCDKKKILAWKRMDLEKPLKFGSKVLLLI